MTTTGAPTQVATTHRATTCVASHRAEVAGLGSVHGIAPGRYIDSWGRIVLLVAHKPLAR